MSEVSASSVEKDVGKLLMLVFYSLFSVIEALINLSVIKICQKLHLDFIIYINVEKSTNKSLFHVAYIIYCKPHE